ncbi:MAG: flavodoxin family protein [Moorellales bacterium]
MADTAEEKKIVGLSCGRPNGNCETLLRAAAMAAEEYGVKTEIIRATELDIRRCRGCDSCLNAYFEGKSAKCPVKDDVAWVLDKTVAEDCALILSIPVFYLRSNALFMCITERLHGLMFGSNLKILEKKNVGAIISVGGGPPDWTPLALVTANIFLQHHRILVDQMQVNRVPVVLNEQNLERAKRLGANVARAMQLPPEEVRYLGDDTPVSCPVCHCNVLVVPEELPTVYCPVCWVRGKIVLRDGRMEVSWNPEDVREPRFSLEGVRRHLADIARWRTEVVRPQVGKVKEIARQFEGFGALVSPPHEPSR